MKYLFIFFIIIIPCTVLANDHCTVLVIVGMKDEYTIAYGKNTAVIVGTANATRLKERLQTVNAQSINAVFSFGVAGALNNSLTPGDLLFSQEVITQINQENNTLTEVSLAVDPNLLTAATLYAKKAGVKSSNGIFLGADAEAREQKADEITGLYERTGAQIIDNESHIAALFASEHSLPFLSIRAVSDSVDQPLPPAALLPLNPIDGSPDGWAIIKNIVLNPAQIPALIYTARNYNKALHSLEEFHDTIGFQKLAAATGSCHF